MRKVRGEEYTAPLSHYHGSAGVGDSIKRGRLGCYRNGNAWAIGNANVAWGKRSS